MDRIAFDGAKDKLRLLLNKLAEMESASDIQRLSDRWLDFLNEAQRVFLKMRKATERCSAKGWYDLKQNERNSDDMLSYNLHARNADEHGISKITELERGGIGINVGGDGYIEHMEISNTRNRMDIKYRGRNPLHFKFIPAEVRLVPVYDRGIRYDVPKKHMGKPIEAKPLVVAKLSAAYLTALIEEAEQKFPLQ